STRLLLRAQRHVPASYYRADMCHLPFREQTFDVVVSLQALQYLDKPESALRQMARVLKPGGLLLLSVPNDLSIKYRYQGIAEIQIQRFDSGRLASLLAPSFNVLSVQLQGFWLPAPKLPIHLPGDYSCHWGLTWTVLAIRS